MERVELPEKIFAEGKEPEVDKINNYCRMSILKLVKKRLPSEYEVVRSDPVFGPIMSISENGLRYSARLVHSFLTRQHDTCKMHELWFVFARRPLRFSMQEFHAVTGLKFEEVRDQDFGKWVDDKGFWSEFLKNEKNTISTKSIRKEHLLKCNQWSRADRIRLVYVCVIAGLLLPTDEKTVISHKYIRLVMDVAKLRAYHWGLDSFDHLLKAIKDVHPKLDQPSSYSLHGFTYALQIWIMEAIPDIGTMLARKKTEDRVVFPRCSNWTGSCVLKYPELRRLEANFKSGVLHPFISFEGNVDIVQAVEYTRSSEMRDERVDLIYQLYSNNKDWTKQVWKVVVPKQPLEAVVNAQRENESDHEPVDDAEMENENIHRYSDVYPPNSEVSFASTSRKGKSKIRDYGAEERKQKVLCERAAATNAAVTDEYKSFIIGMFEASFANLEKKIQKTIQTEVAARFDVVHRELKDLKDLSRTNKLFTSRVEASTSTKAPIATTKRQSQSEKNKGKKTDMPPVVLENLRDVNVTQTSDLDLDLDLSPDEFLDKTLLNLSQRSVVNGFDPTPSTAAKSVVEPKSAAKSTGKTSSGKEGEEQWKGLSLVDIEEASCNEPDAPLVLVREKEIALLLEWGRDYKTKPKLPFGPTIFTFDLADRFMSHQKWLKTQDMDAFMYFLREKISLGHLDVGRVGLMSCNFGTHITGEYKRFLAEKKKYVVSSILVDYGKGELPAHGRTTKVWDVDVDRIYVPFNVHNSHWISLCINFREREVRVFDCENGTRNRVLNAFLHIIPRIVMAVQSPEDSKQMKVSAYKIKYELMPQGLNRRHCHCGPYALKYIECDMLGMDFSVLNDENIRWARHKMVIDMFLAANDPVFIDRMSKYEPPITRTDPDIVDIA